MGTGYTRNDTGNNIADGNVINASDLDGEFDAVEAAFNASTGHTHDGTSAEGAPIEVVGPAQDLVITATEVRPKTDNTLDLGTGSFEFKDLYLDGTANIDSLVADTADINAGTIDGTTIGGSTPAAGTFTTLTANGNVVLGDAATDTVTVTADVASDLIPSADGTYDLGASGSEWQDLYIDGTANIDSLVADTADINGGTIDSTTIGGSTPAAGSFTTVSATGDVDIADKIVHTGDTNTAIRFPAADTVTVETGGSEAMRIDSSGNVGIGTSSATQTLVIDVNSSNTNQFSFDGITIGNSNVTTNNGSAIAFSQSGSNGNSYARIGVINTDRTNGSEDQDIFFGTTGGGSYAERMRIDSSGNVGIGTTSPVNVSGVPDLTVAGKFFTSDGTATNPAHSFTGDQNTGIFRPTTDTFAVTTGGSERMRIDSSGTLLVGKTASSLTTAGFQANSSTGQTDATVSGSECMNVTRLTDDGNLIRFFQDAGFEGSISVSGSTVSYNGGHLARWSRLADDSKDTSIVKGTVMTNLDEMVEWGDEDNEQLNKMAVSSVEGDPNVAGVFVNWDEDDDWNDMNIAMTGDMVIRIAQGTTVQRGDLLMSAGDGTAKPQGDDIVRSKTIAKVTSTHVSHTYDDGSYLVPCVLMAC